MQQASALLTPGRTNPSLRGQTRRLPGKTKWAAARLTTRAPGILVIADRPPPRPRLPRTQTISSAVADAGFNIGSLNAATHPIDASLSYVTMVVAPLGRPEFTLDFVDLPEAG